LVELSKLMEERLLSAGGITAYINLHFVYHGIKAHTALI